MDKITKYIEALKNGKGYDWIIENGCDLSKTDLIRIIQELDYAISDNAIYPIGIYKAAADELKEWYCDEEE